LIITRKESGAEYFMNESKFDAPAAAASAAAEAQIENGPRATSIGSSSATDEVANS
jgi:hypothetical protein